VKLTRAIVDFALPIAPVALVAGATLGIFMAMPALGVPIHFDPVVQVLAVACTLAWRLWRGSPPLAEIQRVLHIGRFNVERSAPTRSHRGVCQVAHGR
jgi:hypothetical protein